MAISINVIQTLLLAYILFPLGLSVLSSSLSNIGSGDLVLGPLDLRLKLTDSPPLPSSLPLNFDVKKLVVSISISLSFKLRNYFLILSPSFKKYIYSMASVLVCGLLKCAYSKCFKEKKAQTADIE